MRINDSFARQIRLQHLYRSSSGGLLIVPLDHPLALGSPIAGGRLDRLVGEIADNGADAVVLHKGAIRDVRPTRFREMSLIVHLSASTGLAADPDAKYGVATVEEALRAGAHGVSVHVNVGSWTEPDQIGHLAGVSEACERWGLPLLAMVYARGPKISDGRAPAVVVHATTIATELGADLVKTALPERAADIAAITRDCALPVIAAGGSPAASTLAWVAEAIGAGAAGVAAGRLVFTSDDPASMVRRLAAIVHDRTPVGVR